MKIVRLSAIVVILSTLVVGFVLDQEPRTFDDFAPVDRLGVPATSTGTWFCPGGSGEGGSAVVGLEIVNAGTEPATAEITARPAAPAPSTDSALSRTIPPMAISGCGEAAAAALSSSGSPRAS